MTDNRTIRLSDAIEAAPCTARKPRANAYDSGFFDATIAYQKALSALPAVGGWLDIQSAPVGEHIIAAVKVRNNKTGEEWWDMHTVLIDDETGEIEADNDAGWLVTDYSHYMPLPAPPIE